jgi:hypothetical protein
MKQVPVNTMDKRKGVKRQKTKKNKKNTTHKTKD